MSPPEIFSSPFLNLNTINTILSSPGTIPTEQKIQLLEAKIHLLTSSLPNVVKPLPLPKTNESAKNLKVRDDQRDKAIVVIDKIRLELGRSYLSLKIPDYIKAEMELGIIDKDCKNLIKRIEKDRKSRNQEYDPKNSDDQSSGVDSTEGDIVLLEEIKQLRIMALQQMILVEEGLGRDPRADRWRKTIEDVQETRST